MGRIVPWADTELDLLMRGEPVPGRTRAACKKMRMRQGISKAPEPRPKTPKQEPVKVPRQEPEWWGRARRYLDQGLTVLEVARAVGRTYQAVAYATDPDVRARMKRTSRALYSRKGISGSKVGIDYKRLIARREAREQWFKAGMPGHVTTFYRRLDCL